MILDTHLMGIWYQLPEPLDLLEVIWAKNYNDFVSYIKYNGIPDAICFDHDLGDDVARDKVSIGMSKKQDRKDRWIDYCLDNDLTLPLWNVQRANPVGKDNINGILYSFNRFVK